MASRFWINGTGNWTDTSHWSDSSGGSSGFSAPVSGDTATFDASSGGGTVTCDIDISCDSITMGAFNNGIFDANNHNFNLITFSYSGSAFRTLKMGSGTWNISGNNGTVWNMATLTSSTILATSATVNFTYIGSVGTRVMSVGTVNMFAFKVSGGSDIFQSTTTGSFGYQSADFTGFTGTWKASAIKINGRLTLNPAMTMTVTAGVTITVGSLNAVGILGNVITLNSLTNGSSWTLSSSGAFVCDYMSIRDSHASGGSYFFAGYNSNNVSGNTGWVFSNLSTSGFQIFMT